MLLLKQSIWEILSLLGSTNQDATILFELSYFLGYFNSMQFGL